MRLRRASAIRFRFFFRESSVEKLSGWLHDAQHPALYGIRRVAQTLTLDLAVVRNVIIEPWSNGHAEYQINRLKMLKRAMYARTGVESLQARMMPFRSTHDHTV